MMIKLNIAPIVGASHPVILEVARVSENYNLEKYRFQTLHRWCGRSDIPKGRGQFGVALDRDWTHCIPITITADGVVEIVSIGRLVDNLVNHKELTITFSSV
jgi:hypothetical protein